MEVDPISEASAIDQSLNAVMGEMHGFSARSTPVIAVAGWLMLGWTFGWETGQAIWFGGLIFASALHWFAYLGDYSSPRWRFRSIVAQAAMGTAWGLLTALAMPDDPAAQGLAVATLLGVASTSVAFAPPIRSSTAAFLTSLGVVASLSTAITGTGYMRIAFLPILGSIAFYFVMADHLHRNRLETMRLTAELEHRANTDPLTGAMNRRAFNRELTDEIAHRGVAQVAFIDLDRFKSVNDTLGHDAGDELLTLVVRRLRGLGARVGAVGRIGGDEFTVLAAELGDAHEFGELVLSVFDAPFVLGRHNMTVKGSVGVSTHSGSTTVGGSDLVAALITAADLAQLESKRAGGSRVAVAFT